MAAAGGRQGMAAAFRWLGSGLGLSTSKSAATAAGAGAVGVWGVAGTVRASSTSAETTDSEVGIVSGIPQEHLERKVWVYSPALDSVSQGIGNKSVWKLEFNSTEKWENPLMGWTSTADPLSCVGQHALSFESKEAAIEFAKKHGWQYEVREPHWQYKRKPKVYANNFRWKGPPPK